MSFRVMARTILELGAELISSDGIALYELIKNGIDAGSRSVRVEVEARVLASQFDELEAVLQHGENSTRALLRRFDDLVVNPKFSSIAVELLDDLRERLEKADPDDRRMTLRAWYGEHSWIAVIDRGQGMDLDDLEDVYLTIGTRSRRRDRRRPDGGYYLGEKGVGRLSTMRLGDVLEVRTSKSGDPNYSLLDIDWERFSHDSDDLLDEVPISPRRGRPKSDADKSGTRVTIRGLRADWTEKKLLDVAQDEFSKLVDPFEPDTANSVIRLTYNGERIYFQEIDRRILDLAHGRVEARFEIADGRPILRGYATYALRQKERTFTLNAADLLSAAGISAPGLLTDVGPFDLHMWWFNRRLLKTVDELGTRQEITREVAKWSGGLMLFRDGYRVNPYGSVNDDWLSLDKAAFASKGFKLNRQQVVGRVRISWRNEGLIDQTNREGLFDTPEKRVFVALLRHVLLTEFKAWLDREDKAARVQEHTTLENIEEKIEATETDIRGRLRQIERVMPQGDRHLVKSALELIEELTGYLAEVKAISEEVANDRQQLVHLAGIGLMVEFIMHELARTTSSTLSTLREMDRSELERSTSSALTVLSDQLVTLSKRVDNLDPLSAARRQQKEDFDVGAVITEILNGRKGQIARHNVKVRGNYASTKGFRVKAVRGMFIQIIENLFSNSFYWLKRQADLQEDFRSEITVDLDVAERTVMITDNGPGVALESASDIFQPFYTRKPAGEGHGLGLYISREVAAYHGWTLDIERAPTVHPERLNTFVLEMSR